MSEDKNLPAIPEYLKQFISEQPNKDVDSLAFASISIPRISLRGRVFRFIEGGEEVYKVSESVNLIILGVEPEGHRFIKTYYDKTYAPGDNAPPTCGSDDGIRPSGWITNPQNDLCATCPKNAFGSAKSRTDKPAKACRDSKRIWVVRADDPKGTAFGLNVPVMSLKSLAEFGRQVKPLNVPISCLITTVEMEDNEFPQLIFKLGGFVGKDEAQLVMKRSAEKEWKALIAPPNSAQALEAPKSNNQLLNDLAQQATTLPEKQSEKPVSEKTTNPASVDDLTSSW